LQAAPLHIDSLFRLLRKSHYDYATELFFGFVGGGLAVSVFERQPSSTLERDDFSSNRPALSFCLRMIFSENRCPLFPDHALASRTLLTLLSTVQIFSHSAAEVHRLSAHRAQAS
jgi:hypothetical protein